MLDFSDLCKGQDLVHWGPGIFCGNQGVPAVSAGDTLRYLGVKFGPWRGLIKGSEVPTILGAVANTGRLKLKPVQKVELLRTYILPRFIYSLSANKPAKGTLRMLDQQVRQVVKGMLHLVPSTATGLFYTSQSKGGLGLIRFERAIQLATIKAHVKLAESRDPVMQGIRERGGVRVAAQKCAQALGSHRLPENLEQFNALKQRTREELTNEWERLGSQGQGVRTFRKDRIGNRWLGDPKLLGGSRYVDALRLRTNTFGTRVVLSRTTAGMDVRCRRCHVQPETLGHVIGSCVATKPARIRRHDEIKNLVAQRVAARHTVMVEPTVNVAGELKKPDLVIELGNELVVADVTVRFENKTYLADAAKEKVDKYRGTAEMLRVRLNKETCSVMPIVVGCRGAMPWSTQSNLLKLGLTKGDLLTVSLIALRLSTEIANAFIDE